MDIKRPISRHIVNKMLKVKDKERILKAARKKQLVTHRGIPIRLSAFSKAALQTSRDWQELFSHEEQAPTAKIALPRNDII